MSRDRLEWRIVPSNQDYEVSDCGDLRRASTVPNQPGRRLKGIINSDGYLDYAVRDQNGDRYHLLAHVAVAEAFVGPKPAPGFEVAHCNGSRLLNTPGNLRWATRKQNSDDRHGHGTDARGTRNPTAKLSEDDVRYIRRRYREIKAERGRVAELDEQFGITRSQVIRVANRQAWGHVQ